MRLDFKLFPINPLMQRASVSKIYANPGDRLQPGTKLLELYVDLSDAAPHDCPPVSRYCIFVRELLWLRDLKASVGDEIEIGGVLASFTQSADEPLSVEAARPARVAVAGVLSEPDWWDEPAIG